MGEMANYLAVEQKVTITGHPLLTKTVNGETIYLRADTFIAISQAQKEAVTLQEIHALHNVQLYQEQLQGIADGAIYNTTTDTIQLHNKPIIWCNNYQITGESVSLTIEKEEMVKLFVSKNLFMVSADPVGNYNQIKGEKMVATFREGVVEKMSIEGNGESLYFVLGEKNELMGMNHIKCNHMEMTMANNALEHMECKPKPVGLFYPVEKIAQRKLEGFIWHGEKWPTKASLLANDAPTNIPYNHATTE